jgi:4-coumarate--CoA ligase
MFGLIGAVTLAPYQGHFLCIQRVFDFRKYIETSSMIKATILRMVPPIAIAITKDDFVQTLDLTSMHTILCAGAPLQVDVVQALQTLMGEVRITQGYGSGQQFCLHYSDRSLFID